ncbi:aromatic amino acid aminotransferase [Malassezia pachydermatis]|uniref:Aromatic amino acid aminotransferase n=1 Tax=Malassezia pachydermatis TaxID=77020 RepID=A0A0M9VN26_9BASI|nr:aromatic amino acid aminotransferase [Malassezia pachydermatis]KOS12632.1 aromatic amino acid aminotransferase [Malassezia pachydermatis]
MPLDYGRIISQATQRRPKPAIRSLLELESRPGMISFLAGKPNPNGFPFESMTVKLKPSAVMSTDPATNEPIELKIDGDDLERVLQYSITTGEPVFHETIDAILSAVHHRTRGDGTPAGEFSMAIGTGSQDLLAKASFALFDEGDVVLVESPMYPGLLPDFASRGVRTVNIEQDSEGISDKTLEDTLANWKTTPATADLPFPKAVYTVPCGGNPSGTTASADRKRAILKLAREYNLLILEDDPYYYIAFEGLGEDPVTRPRIPSYFALENEEADKWGYGYVLRFESFSKIMSAGMRLGFAVGPTPLIQAIAVYTATSNLHTSAPIQALAGLLLKHWGVSGFLHHVDAVSKMYEHRRDVFGSKLDAILGRGTDGQPAVASWNTPVAGMFFWIKLHLPPTPEAPEGDSFEVIKTKAVEENVLAVPGNSFFSDQRSTPYMRVSFSLIGEEDMEEGLRRIRRAVEAAWKDAGYDAIPPLV